MKQSPESIKDKQANSFFMSIKPPVDNCSLSCPQGLLSGTGGFLIMKTINTLIVFFLIVFMAMMIFREDREHWRQTAEQYRRGYLRALEVIESMEDETLEMVKYENGRLVKAYHAIKDKRKDQWPYSSEEWDYYMGEK